MNIAEKLIWAATDYIAATLEKADVRTWQHLIVYIPSHIVEERAIQLREKVKV